ncbi:o-succinylbenzoate synthase [Aphanothece sacrum]|uniref:o-succinylbenzoate synthase n=1 Tax=Aphanothece sacrum FPU1 TaxID=1920663 RepID=A0A401IMT8_APHSA|nr:o-succinylbenzoate synthase [Aphanothece sacrum]GBF82561.1 O-succinylbenzoate synthase [Aphanothece sacrum FPU1]GBF84695.1 O-succinylbenzoate synthase [Aphanothece sacrum FPU3]
MKIEQADIFLFELPLVKNYVTSFGNITKKRSILVKLYSEGLVGYGEGSSLPFPFYLPEYADVSFLVLQDIIIPEIIGKSFNHPQEIVESFRKIRGYSFAKTAVETAFWDLYSQEFNIPLWEILGGVGNIIDVGSNLGIIRDKQKLIDEVQKKVDDLTPRIKLKIERNWDIKPISIIRENFPTVPLCVDANSAYTLKDIPHLKEFDQFNLMMIEQPLAWDDIIDHAELQQHIKTPICLDESILSAEDARRAIKIKACQIINIKPGRVGGLVEAKKIHDICLKNKINIWCGGMLECSVGRFFNLSIATLIGYSLPADMFSSYDYFADDIVDFPYASFQGKAFVPDNLSNFKVNDEKVEHYSIAKRQIRVLPDKLC